MDDAYGAMSPCRPLLQSWSKAWCCSAAMPAARPRLRFSTPWRGPSPCTSGSPTTPSAAMATAAPPGLLGDHQDTGTTPSLHALLGRRACETGALLSQLALLRHALRHAGFRSMVFSPEQPWRADLDSPKRSAKVGGARSTDPWEGGLAGDLPPSSRPEHTIAVLSSLLGRGTSSD